jgi:hypothetical protein
MDLGIPLIAHACTFKISMFSLLFLILRTESWFRKSLCCLCVCPPTNPVTVGCLAEPICMKLGMHGTWAHQSLPSVCVSVCVSLLPLLDNGSVNTFPQQRRIVGDGVPYAVRAISEESTKLIFFFYLQDYAFLFKFPSLRSSHQHESCITRRKSWISHDVVHRLGAHNPHNIYIWPNVLR